MMDDAKLAELLRILKCNLSMYYLHEKHGFLTPPAWLHGELHLVRTLLGNGPEYEQFQKEAMARCEEIETWSENFLKTLDADGVEQ